MRKRCLSGSGCPFCSGHKVCGCSSLAVKQSELMKQWDWEGNQDIDAYSLGCATIKKVSWICTEHGQWDATPNVRVNLKRGCPECAKQRRSGPYTRGLLRHDFPDVYAELHPTKNDSIDMEMLTSGSGRRVWWLCQGDNGRPEGCQHEHAWAAQVKQRCNKRNPTGCPFCSGYSVCPCKSLTTREPTLLQNWDYARNTGSAVEPLTPSWLGTSSTKKVSWHHKCADGQVHHWRAMIGSEFRNFRASNNVPCPRCSGNPTILSEIRVKHPGKLVRRKHE